MNFDMVTETFARCASSALFLTAVCTALTNIVVEVFKGLLPRVPTALLVVIVAEGITVPALTVIGRLGGLMLSWYWLFGAVILGIIVAYAAMGNFDKLTEIIGKLKEYSNKE